MLFKPNFCCNCGSKIERADWSVLASRRFCDACAAENKLYDWLPRAAIASAALAGIFSLGVLTGRPGQADPATVSAEPNDQIRKIAVGAKQQSGIKEPENISSPVTQSPAAATVALPNSAPEAARDQRGAATSVPVYFCGAMTKKGTPCSRRVKTKGRCWQHTGQPSAAVSQSAPDVY